MHGATDSLPTRTSAALVAWGRRARVRHWAHFLALPLAGFSASVPRGEVALSLARGIATAFCVLAFGYLVNAVADRHMDDPGKNLIADSSAESATPIVVTLAALALGLAALGPLVALISTAICLFSGWIYSVGPRLKAVPAIGTVLNATNFAPLLFVGVARNETARGLAWLSLAFVGLLLQNQLLHEAADVEEDARGGVLTTVRALGPVGTAAVSALMGAAVPVSIVLSGASAVASGAAALAFGVAFPAALVLRGGDHRLMQRVRRAHRFASVAMGAVIFALLQLGAR